MEHLEDADNMEIDDSEMPDDSDIVAFVSGLLLGNDQQVRNWFALFVRNGQKVCMLHYLCFIVYYYLSNTYSLDAYMGCDFLITEKMGVSCGPATFA